MFTTKVGNYSSNKKEKTWKIRWFVLVLTRINEATFISVTTDSTPDVSHREMYSIIIRFVHNFEVEERLVDFDEMNSKVGRRIVDFLLSSFKKNNISSNKIIGQSYDGASNMTGKFAGVQAVLSEELGQNIIFIPCGAHKSNIGNAD